MFVRFVGNYLYLQTISSVLVQQFKDTLKFFAIPLNERWSPLSSNQFKLGICQKNTPGQEIKMLWDFQIIKSFLSSSWATIILGEAAAIKKSTNLLQFLILCSYRLCVCVCVCLQVFMCLHVCCFFLVCLFSSFYSGFLLCVLDCLFSKNKERKGMGLNGWSCRDDL